MMRSITTLERMGQQDARLIVEQAKGMAEAKSVDDYLTEKTIVQLFAEPDIAELLCCTAAVRQMSGQVVHFPPREEWRRQAGKFTLKLLGAVSYYMDAMLVNGLDVSAMKPEEEVSFPVVNCGGPDSHPARALADVACMMQHVRGELGGFKVCWLGGPSGELCSLITASGFFGFPLHVFAPASPRLEMVKDLAQEQAASGAVFATTKAEALEDASFCFIGSREDMDIDTAPQWVVTPSFLRGVKPNVQLLLGVSPHHCLLLDTRFRRAGEGHSLLLRQAEFRLKVYKRFFHYIFD
ncbi:MAG: hypothetical protein K6C33_08530 [Desulfovibrio sp.]|jgi:ornithine carbamoyltransferase|nr:hypothetical protein [Desulfovibrio sp.]MCR5170486.1 hypothetical protein [Desulfovibrio sp.]